MSENFNIPMVTVVIACHNYGRWVKDAISSVVAQDYPRVQIAVVNDGSTDDTQQQVVGMMENITQVSGEIIKGSIKSRNIVSILNNKATGPSAARNKAIKVAWNFCDLFMILDADDVYLQGKISKSVEQWLKDPGMIGLVYTDYFNVNEEGLHILEYKEPFSLARLSEECIIPPHSLISKQAFEAVGFYDEEMRCCEDWDLELRICEKFLAIHIAEPLVTMRVHKDNSTNTVDKEIWQQNWRRRAEKMYARRNQYYNP